MIQSKKIQIIVAVALIFALTLSLLFVTFGGSQSANGGTKTEPLYATQLFGTDIISIEILADEALWQEMLDNAISEQFIMADVIVNGTRYQNVGIRPKGNSSLTQVAQSSSDRYSFRLQFDEYIKEQTCFGLESFVINNMLGDNTYMKEYVSYDLMNEIGVDCPYFGFADIKVNGNAWGLYLAVEMYNDSYEQRVSGDTSGMLYNVKSMEMGGEDNTGDSNLPNMQDGASGRQRPNGGNFGAQQGGGTQESANDPNGNTPDGQVGEDIQGGTQPGNRLEAFTLPNANNGGFARSALNGGGSSGGSLEYSNDDSSSYSAIFNNVVGKGSEEDYQKVIAALKALSENEDLEKYFDVDQILRYLAAHTVVVNLDSYSSSMAQNYYIYELDGKITILPWDYNLAWGGFQSGNASSIINFPIDTPVSGVEMSARPLIEKLFANEEYLERYHGYLQELIDKYFANGTFETKINALNERICEYVKNDATAFCTYEDYQKAIATFITLGNLRAESVQGQLDGMIPSTTAEQNTDSSALVSAGTISLNDLGSMMGNNRESGDAQTNGGIMQQPQGRGNFAGGDMPDSSAMQQAVQIIQNANGEITDEIKTQLAELGLTDDQISMLSGMGAGNFPEDRQAGEAKQNNSSPMQRGSNVSSASVPQMSDSYLLLISALVLVLAGATVFAAKYKKSY